MLVVTQVQDSDSGNYVVQVSNSGGFTNSLPGTLVVLARPGFTVQPASQTVMVGSNVTFSVTATGTQPLSYQWFKNGIIIAGATATSYAILSVQTNDVGSYSVQVSNAVGSITSTGATLSVTLPPPSITVRHASAYPGTITFDIDGQRYIIEPGQTIQVLVAAPTQLYIWECIFSGSVQNCEWDAYSVTPRSGYKIVDVGTPWDLALVLDP